jgi:ring-1,2-phenylacetyl-CoA epoxidase subunit PaaE
VAAYALYITMHDAAHGGVSRARWVNELVGRLSCPVITPLLAFPAFRYMHLCHHGATNEPDSDPDMWASGESFGQLVWRFATIDVGYYAFYLRRIRDRPRGELLDAGASLLTHVTIVAVLCGLGLGREVLLFWILPGRVTVFFLAWVLDYLPHRPHRIRQRDDAYRATCIRVGHEAWISPLMLWQNYHLSHHLYPRAPFWRTVALWRAREQWHLNREPELVTIWGRPLSADGYRALRGLPSLDESESGEHAAEAAGQAPPRVADERASLAG